MKSLNNLLLLGDGETWSRQKIDFSGLPEMVRTFLQVAAGAADIPVTRLLGQSPAGMSSTGESDTRNYYDMIAARQAIDLKPQLERLDALILRSAGVDPVALSFEFRPLWQMDAAASATIALQKAQATQIYAGLNLWPAAVTAKLVQSQLIEDGPYPSAEGIFAEVREATRPTTDFNFNQAQLRDPDGRWTRGGASGYEQGYVQHAAEKDPPLRRIHPDTTYETDLKAKRSLEYWRTQPTEAIIESFKKNENQQLLVKPDGRIVGGNTRVKVLQERGYPVDGLPRTFQPGLPMDDLLKHGGGIGGAGGVLNQEIEE